MSKILEALQKAQEAREQEAREQEARDKAKQEESKRSGTSEVQVAFKNTPTQDLWEHVRALEGAFNRRLTRMGAPEAPAAEPAETSLPVAAEPEQAARPMVRPAPESEVFFSSQSASQAELAPEAAAQPAEPAQTAKPKIAEPASAAMPASPSDAIQKAIQQIQLRLVETEQLSARYATEQASLMAQLTAYDEMTAQLEEERSTIHQRVTQLAASATSLEIDRKSLHNDIEMLRECYVLSHAAVIAEQELQTTHAVVSQLTQSQQRIGAEMTQYRQREDELQRLVIRLRSQLTQILAGTTGEPKGEERPQ